MLTKQEFDQLKLDLKKKVDKKAILKVIEDKYTSTTPDTTSSFLPPKGQEHIHKVHGNTQSSPFEKKRGVKIATQGSSERGDASKGISPSIGA